jgi:hypothetical protein
VLGRETEPHAACDEGLQQGTGRQELGDQGRGLDHLLEVVEHQQGALVAEDRYQPVKQRLVSRLPYPKRLRNGRQHQARVTDRSKFNGGEAIWEAIGQLVGDAQRKAGLADPAWTSEGQERNILAQQ